MDIADDGYFTYDDKYPPICIKPPLNQLEEYKQSMEGAITSYLQDSYKDGVKHEDAILANGLAVGEAGVFYFRDLHNKRRKPEKQYPELNPIIEKIIDSIKQHMNIYVSWAAVEQSLTPRLFQTKQYPKKLLMILKKILSDMNMKTKGYTAKLKQIIQDIDLFVRQYNNNNNNQNYPDKNKEEEEEDQEEDEDDDDDDKE
jgi:hypothetical protein